MVGNVDPNLLTKASGSGPYIQVGGPDRWLGLGNNMTKHLDRGQATRQRNRYIALVARQREKQTRAGGNIGTRETKREIKIENRHDT